jgi:hypothetical protein
MMIQIIYDIRYFMIIVMEVLFGFCQAFWILYLVPAGAFPSLLQGSFLFMVGLSDPLE